MFTMTIKTYSGDYYKIEKDSQYLVDLEVKLYHRAANEGDEEVMLYFEEGHTGWSFLDGQ